jgi:hypothetical protein
MKVACIFRLGDRRDEATETREGGFRIIIAETVTPRVSNPHDYVNHMFKRPHVLMNF